MVSPLITTVGTIRAGNVSVDTGCSSFTEIQLSAEGTPPVQPRLDSVGMLKMRAKVLADILERFMTVT